MGCDYTPEQFVVGCFGDRGYEQGIVSRAEKAAEDGEDGEMEVLMPRRGMRTSSRARPNISSGRKITISIFSVANPVEQYESPPMAT